MSKLAEAKDWLEELLADGPVDVPEVQRLAVDAGIAPRTLRRSADELEVQRRKVGAPGEADQRWVWSLAANHDATGRLRSEAFHLLSSLVLEDGQAWISAAETFQVDDAAAILADDGPRLHYLTRPRGASKTTDLAAVAIAVLLTQLPPRARAYAFAADQDQAALLLDALAGFCARTEGLGSVLKIDNYKVTTPTGARLDIQSSDAASSWGLKAHLLIADEFCQWATTPGPRRLWQAILSAVPKVEGCRLVLLSTAGDPAHPSYRLLEQAKTSDRWRVHEVPGPVPWISPDALAEQKRLCPNRSTRACT